MTDVYSINGGYACLKWEPRFTIIFSGNGGSVSVATVSGRYQYTDSTNTSANATYTPTADKMLYAKWTLGSGTLPATSRDGYQFNGWYTAQTGGAKAGGIGESYTPSANITLFARWTANTNKAHFNDNGATGGTGTSSNKAAAGFDGWAVSANGARDYEDNDIKMAISKSITHFLSQNLTNTNNGIIIIWKIEYCCEDTV